MTATHTRNILRVLRNSSALSIAEGMSWYNDAHELAREIGNNDEWLGAGVIAAFSPLTPWWRNVELAVASCRTGIARTDTLGNSSRAAQRMLDGEHPLDVLNGDKTRAFCENIALNGFSDSATVDVHAYSIAINKPTPSSQIKGLGKAVYADIAKSYYNAAVSSGLLTTQVQAITWCEWRRMHPLSTKRKNRGSK